MDLSDDAVIAQTTRWLERAVIGLNLCPFAKAVHVNAGLRYRVSAAQTREDLLTDLVAELQYLHAADPNACETTLLIHPHVLNDFLDYNDFLDIADAALDALKLADHIQVASFHPQYQFADTAPQDISNYTNRSPYPMLHLLRQDSVDRAVEAFPEAAQIYEANIERMHKLGLSGWQALWRD